MGDFAYISIIALLCYTFLLLAFIAAKKNNTIKAFLTILVVLILWTGGSFCMRMQIWPSTKVWYDISILGLTLLPYAFLRFMCEFADLKNLVAKRFWLPIIITVNIINIFTGFFQKAPEVIAADNGKTIFVYHYGWQAFLLFAICSAIVINMLYILLKYSKKNTQAKEQFKPLLIGIVILFLGHIAIMIPVFKGFPTDILSGVMNAFFMFYALNKKKLFQLKLVVSRGTCYAITAALSFGSFFYLISPLEKFINQNFPVSSDVTIMTISFIFALSISLIYYIMKHFLDMIFIKDEKMQSESLKEFSLNISKSLNVNEILDKLAEVVQKVIPVKKVFICILDKKTSCYEIVHSSNPLDIKKFSIKKDNPLVDLLDKSNECLLMKDFKSTVVYKSMWENEKKQLMDMDIECFVPLRDDRGMIGIVLLSEKEKKSKYTYKEISFLDSVNSIGSIAVKNSQLFEQVYLEARTDDLTGLLNRKYFYEILNIEYEKNKGGSLA
ncbi:MAG: histidine kinase N-terminal 7TM domain-containing protein, partial [Mobilitalea sp.]